MRRLPLASLVVLLTACARAIRAFVTG